MMIELIKPLDSFIVLKVADAYYVLDTAMPNVVRCDTEQCAKKQALLMFFSKIEIQNQQNKDENEKASTTTVDQIQT